MPECRVVASITSPTDIVGLTLNDQSMQMMKDETGAWAGTTFVDVGRWFPVSAEIVADGFCNCTMKLKMSDHDPEPMTAESTEHDNQRNLSPCDRDALKPVFAFCISFWRTPKPQDLSSILVDPSRLV